jgi:hypothetical protein
MEAPEPHRSGARPSAPGRTDYATLRAERVARRTSKNPYRLFFSYSHKDRWIARQCVRSIEECGAGAISVFLDERDIEAGDSIPEAVRDGIEASEELVVLLTPNSKSRPWVFAEIMVAWAFRKTIDAITYCIGAEEMPEQIAQVKAVELNEFDLFLPRLAKRAKGGR